MVQSEGTTPAHMMGQATTTTASASQTLTIDDKDNKLQLSMGNFIGGLGATALVPFSVAMNQVMEGSKVNLTGGCPLFLFLSFLFFEGVLCVVEGLYTRARTLHLTRPRI